MQAIILAGGKSSRMGKEKGFIEIGGVKMVDLVVERVKESKIEDFFIATSIHAQKTKKYAEKKRYNVIETPGAGYHEDLLYLLRFFPVFLSIACDIPFLRSEHIDAIIDFYERKKGKSKSVTGAVPMDIIPSYVAPSYVMDYEGRKLVVCGLNVVTNAKESSFFIFNDPSLAVNINTVYDLEIYKRVIKYGLKKIS